MIVIVFLLVAISAVSKAVVDAISHGFSASIFGSLNPNWWNPKLSWKNKYKPKNPVLRYLLSTIFVTFTDAWHTFEFIRNKSLVLAVVLATFTDVNLTPWWAAFLIVAVGHQTIFHFCYYAFRRI